MATRNIIPRADGEGQVGLAAQAWGKVYADEIYEGGERVTPASLATTSAAGLVELATDAEFDTGTDTARYASVAQIRQMRTGWKNLLINGNFDVWQRGTTFSASGYTADRWMLENGTNSIVEKVTRTNGMQALRFARGTNTAIYQTFCQSIELPKYYIGKTLTFSGTIKCNVDCSSGMWLEVGWESGDRVSLGNEFRSAVDLTNTTDEQTFKVSFTVPDGTDFTYFVVRLRGTLSVGTAEYDIVLSELQLELGGCATPFEQRPYGLELALCQRYYNTIDLLGCVGYVAAGGATIRGNVIFPPMRTTPTATLSTAAPAIFVVNASVTGSESAITFFSGTPVGARFIMSGFTGLTEGAVWSGRDSAYIQLSAEL